MLLNSSSFLLYAISAISDNIGLCDPFHNPNVALQHVAKNAPFSGREMLPSDKLSKHSNLFQDNNPVYAAYFLYSRVESRDNDGSGYNVLGISSVCLSKDAPEALDVSCTRHQ
jgi:hypothetical protein